MNIYSKFSHSFVELIVYFHSRIQLRSRVLYTRWSNNQRQLIIWIFLILYLIAKTKKTFLKETQGSTFKGSTCSATNFCDEVTDKKCLTCLAAIAEYLSGQMLACKRFISAAVSDWLVNKDLFILAIRRFFINRNEKLLMFWEEFVWFSVVRLQGKLFISRDSGTSS